MDIEQTGAAAVEAGTATDDAREAVEAPETEAHDGAAQDVDTDSEAEGGEPAEIEEIELSFGAKKLKLAKSALPEEVLTELDAFTKGVQTDYTKKTQEIAEQRKALEAEKTVVHKLGALRGDLLNTYSQGLAIRQELEQLQRVDVMALWQSNPDQARRVSDAIAQKQLQLQQVVARVAQAEEAINAEEQQFTATRVEDGRKYVTSQIKGWSPQVENELIEYVAAQGIPKEYAKDWAKYPKEAVWAYKAMQFDKLQQQAAKAAKPAAAANPAPTAPIKGSNAPARKDPSKMSTEEWMKWRSRQVAR